MFALPAKTTGLLITTLCLCALGFAYFMQYVGGLAPCELCLYQRVPFVINAAAGIILFILAVRARVKAARYLTMFAGLVFIANAIIAFYHVGVEQDWWESAVEGCTFDPQNLTQAALAPPVPCDTVPWSLFGISMAGYNFLLCLIAGSAVLVNGLQRKPL